MHRDSVEDSEKKQNFKLKDWQETKRNIKKSYRYIKNDKKGLVLIIITSLLSMPMSILNPILSAKILLDLNDKLYLDLLKVAGFVLIVNIVEEIINYFSNLVYRKYTIKINYAIQKEVMYETFKLSTKCYDDMGTGIFIDRLRNDTGSIISVFESLSTGIIQILTNIGILAVIFSVSKIMFLFFLLVGLKSFILEKRRINFYYKRHATIRALEEKNTGLITELIRGSRDIKVLNATNVFMKKFDDRINDVNDKRVKIMKQDRRMTLFNSIINEVCDFLFFFVGVSLVENELLAATSLVVLYMYRTRVSSLFNYLTYLVDQVKSFNLSANRVFELIDSNKFPKEKFGNVKVNKLEGNFEFKNVTFGYNEEKTILKDISFKIPSYKTTAIVGKSGSGKTTIFSLMNKLYDVPDNKIFVDGYDINTLSKDSIRNNMSIITQSPYIFNLSIRDNLILVKEKVSDEEMIEACKIASIHDFIMTLPNGYDTIVGENGVTLSGGERQRLAIARALIKKSSIILFDEATSALDNETQANIQDEIHNLQGKYTILIIAHRLSTIINSDNIIMIEDGKVVATGTHDKLLKTSKKYQNLYQADLNKKA